jgi:acetylornithine deacetylase/succinyl-diaminopimelate desuccinylase-like protein
MLRRLLLAVLALLALLAAAVAVNTLRQGSRQLAVIGATDSRHFEGISEHIYRFSPVRARPEDLARFHGTNERISAANLTELIRFNHRLVSQAAGAGA